MVRFKGYIDGNYIEFEGDGDKFLEIVDAIMAQTEHSIYTYGEDYDDHDYFRI
jgi:hypothetical protein